ncbi:hypothetical protein SAMN05192533_12331 [Mesobacillus persicus]|uniref:Small, acid-soluble spore protein, alpha/beta type n=1 Tax=Mesobacillus persicus TaxID=930146 RepID=A0A1H8JXX3_9BACI|nr:hypothetical protein [Mesobacillus persicus]SEN85604.1 hypothetical protein SAMN05192533_12331 [Mesobacillus persicus]
MANQDRSRRNTSRNRGFNEEMSMEQLAKKALAETIRDGGAFARENSDAFKK